MKKKPSTKKQFAMKRTSSRGIWRWRVGMFAASFILVVIGTGLFFYPYQRMQPAPVSSLFSSYQARIMTWIAERKLRLQRHAIAKQATPAAAASAISKNEVEPAIRFEFYTALPTMQITVASAENDSLPAKNRTTRKPSSRVEWEQEISTTLKQQTNKNNRKDNHAAIARQ